MCVLKLNPLYEPSGPWSRRLISGFCSAKRMRVFDSPLDGTLIHCRLTPSRRWYSFTYPGRMESWVSLGRKEGRTNIQISVERESNWRPCGWKAKILQLHQPCPPTMKSVAFKSCYLFSPLRKNILLGHLKMKRVSLHHRVISFMYWRSREDKKRPHKKAALLGSAREYEVSALKDYRLFWLL